MPEVVHRGARSYTRGELERATSEHHVARAIASGEIVAVTPGRYASGPHAHAFVVRAHAAAEATSGIVTGSAALFAIGAIPCPPRVIDVAIPPGHRCPEVAWLAPRRRADPPPHHEWRGIRIAEGAAAVVQAWELSPEDRRVGEVLAALQSTLVALDEVRDFARGCSRLKDRTNLEKVLRGFESGAQSFLEYEGLTRVFAGREWQHFVRQHEITAWGRRRYLDMYDPRTLTAVELDGNAYHSASEQRESDVERDAEIATLGIVTIRLTYRAVMNRPDWCRQVVRGVIAARSPRRMQSVAA